MKSDLDQLMQERDIDVFVIFGDEGNNPYRDYITDGIHASATVIKKRGEAPFLIVGNMEIDEAKKSGLTVYTYVDFGFAELFREYGKDREVFQKHWWRRIFEQGNVRGRVAFYGHGDVMTIWQRLNRFKEDYADLFEIVTDKDPTIFAVARRTKDAAELEKLRDSAQRTSAVLRLTREWLGSHHTDGEIIMNADGKPLTIGDVKHFVRLRLMEHHMEDNEGMIFAQGRDAGVPHSRGENDHILTVGQTIVFDLFPRPIGGGYYHDSTRTWCLGHASPEVQETFDLVLHAHLQSLEALTIGQPTSQLDELVCDIFEAKGHPTPKTNPGTAEGYVHSLGHGLGLDVHESPSIRTNGPDDLVFKAGDVVTIEPGLYYPDRGWGIRVEDTVYVSPDGHIENLTDCPYDLVIPLQN